MFASSDGLGPIPNDLPFQMHTAGRDARPPCLLIDLTKTFINVVGIGAEIKLN